MKVSFVDQLAVQGSTVLHRAEAWSKLLAAMILIAGIILCHHWELLLPLFLLAGILLWRTGLSPVQQLYFYLYPLIFSFLYGHYLVGLEGAQLLVIILRAVTAVMTLLLLMSTTPYIEVFSALNRVLPSVLTDVMFLTYRALFLLAGRLKELLVAIKLRGGASSGNLLRNLVSTGTYLGMAFLTAVDLNERSYWMLLLRGYRGGIEKTEKKTSGIINGVLLLVASIFFLVTVIW